MRGSLVCQPSTSDLCQTGSLHCLPLVHQIAGVTDPHLAIETVGLHAGALSPLALRGCWYNSSLAPCACTESALPIGTFLYPPIQHYLNLCLAMDQTDLRFMQKNNLTSRSSLTGGQELSPMTCLPM